MPAIGDFFLLALQYENLFRNFSHMASFPLKDDGTEIKLNDIVLLVHSVNYLEVLQQSGEIKVARGTISGAERCLSESKIDVIKSNPATLINCRFIQSISKTGKVTFIKNILQHAPQEWKDKLGNI